MKENLAYAFEIMGKGMASIFAVILVLTLIVIFLAKWPAIKAAIINLFRRKRNQE